MAFPTPSTSARIRFGPFELDSTAGTIHKSGIPIKLQPQPYRVLLLLIANAGQVVGREKIQQHLSGGSRPFPKWAGYTIATSVLQHDRGKSMGTRRSL
jgi:DNA-binding response OmpR family regulator